jgi:hypothetical protein
VRWGYNELDALTILEIAAALAVIGVGAMLFRDDPRIRRVLSPVRTWSRSRLTTASLPTVVVLTAVVSLAAVFRIAVGMAATTPAVFGDELVYSSLAKAWATQGEPLLRGSVDVGDSLLVPLFVAPAYRFSATGADAYATLKVMNAIAVSLAAVPAYFLARRVVSRAWSCGVAALTVAVPWTWYAAFVLTESLFYPAFVTFALVLVLTLERPTWRRQLLLVAWLALLCAIRAQALAIGGGVLVAIALMALLERSVRATARAYAPTLGLIGVVAVMGVSLSAAGVEIPTESHHVLFNSLDRVLGIGKWAAWNVGGYAFAGGIVLVAAFPLALAGMLGRRRTTSERSVAVMAVSLAVALLASVALLSASPYGLNVLHERNLFYVTPLLLVCFVHWLANGMQRPRSLTALVAPVAILLPAIVPEIYVVERVNNIDVPTMSFFGRLVAEAPDVDLRLWLVALPVAGVAIVVLARRPLFPLLAVVLAFLAVTTSNDREGEFTMTQDRALGWVDHALPDKPQVTIVHLGYSGPPGSCAYVAAQEQDKFVVWTEFFNTAVGPVEHVYDDVRSSGLSSPKLGFGTGGLVVKDGQPYAPRYVVMDSRQPIVGERLARFDLASLGSPHQDGASLTLWAVDPPLRVLPHAQPLADRPDERACQASQ